MVSIKKVTPDDADVIAAFKQWASEVGSDSERGASHLGNLLHALQLRGFDAVNYGIYSYSRLVGGVTTAGGYINLMWIHWAEVKNGVGPWAAYHVISQLQKRFNSVVVNEPNINMCKALLKIMTPARRGRARCHGSIARITFRRGDLQPPTL